MTGRSRTERSRLPVWQAAWVIARRDFVAILWSRAFLFFLLGPLFPLIVGVLAGGIGSQVRDTVERPKLGIMLTPAETRAITAAAQQLDASIGMSLPEVVPLPISGQTPETVLADANRNLGAVLSGTLAAPRLAGTQGQVEAWRADIAVLIAQARRGAVVDSASVAVMIDPVASTSADANQGQLIMAQGAQILLFLLSMLLAGMVLSNLVEEKGNKIIEILAAAIPMDAVFMGKLFAMLAISFVGIAVWGGVAGIGLLVMGDKVPALAAPAIGWPSFVILFIAYFGMNYLLLGSIFLAIGSLASTVREVQTLSMPVTMSQVLIFFFASLAIASPGSPLDWAAIAFPLSSPYALLARAAQEDTVWIHFAGLIWQGVFVTLFIRMGSRMFRKRVMKSGPASSRSSMFVRMRRKQVA